MRRCIYILLIALSITPGCRKKASPAPPPGDTTENEVRIPEHLAEIYMERRTASGQSSVTMTLSASHKSETNIQSHEALTVSTKQWETVQSQMDFELEKGRRCKLLPTFVEHKDGHDIWEFKLEYTMTQEHEGAEMSKTSNHSKTVAFDGKKPFTIVEDAHHSIIIRPR